MLHKCCKIIINIYKLKKKLGQKSQKVTWHIRLDSDSDRSKIKQKSLELGNTWQNTWQNKTKNN